MTTRLRWLDLLRSAAILGMLVYHLAYDLRFFYDWDLDVLRGGWKAFQVAVASLFLVVVGLSAGFWTRADAFAKGWRRGWVILSAAMVMSLATAIHNEATWIRFGILHLIAATAFLFPFLRRLHPALIAVLGVACMILLPFDLMPRMSSVDYVPPVPWLGPALLGFAAGIPLSKRAWNAPKPSPLLDALAWPGRHSLAIYLLHQPVILAALWLLLAR